MGPDKVYLTHILDEIDFILKRSHGKSLTDILDDETLKRAIARSMEIIGEASKNLSEGFKKRNDLIEWKKIAGLRDKIVHCYFGVNWDIVYDVIRKHLPKLREQIAAIIDDDGEV